MFFTKQLPMAAGLLIVSSVANTVFADIAITYSDPNNANEQMVLTVTNNKASMLIPGLKGQQGRMIYDHGQQKMFIVMDQDKQYIDVDAMMEAMGGLSSMLAGMMENMPEETKGQLGGILGGLGGNDTPAEEPELVKTGKTDSVIGISCEISTISSADQSSEMCLADPSKVGISNADFEILQGMMAIQQKSAKQMGDMLGVRGLELSPGALDQIPLRIKQISGPDSGTSSEVIATSTEVSAESVEIPAGYTPVNMNMLGG